MNATIFHLEPFDRFVHRISEYNGLYAPAEVQQVLEGDAAEAKDARKKLASLHKEFPTGAPLAEQVAFLLRGFAGLRVFGEGDFRTGWDYTAGLLAHLDHDIAADVADVEELAMQVWDRIEAEHPDGLPRTRLLDRDEAFSYIRDWVKPRLS